MCSGEGHEIGVVKSGSVRKAALKTKYSDQVTKQFIRMENTKILLYIFETNNRKLKSRENYD
jgi:hypothetical protein